MGKFRDGMPVTRNCGLADPCRRSIASRKSLEALEKHQSEPNGADADLIERLDAMSHVAAATASFAHPRLAGLSGAGATTEAG